MDLPAEVQLHNELVNLKGGKGTLVAVHANGFYEVKLTFGQSIHRVLLPIQNTVVIFRDPEPVFESGVEIER